MILALSRIYRLMRILSLDVALGGVVLSGSVAYVFGIDMPLSVSVALFIAIWLIYTFDHLMDAHKLSQSASMERHKFHQKYRKVMLVLMVIGVFVGLANLLLLPVVTLIYGTAVGLIVVIYFVLSWKLKVMLIKEVFIASVYATGVFLGPVSLGIENLMILFYLFVQVFVLALLNLLVFSYFEMSYDKQDGQHSWAVKFGQKTTRTHMNLVFMVLAVLQLSSLMILEEDFAILQALFIAMGAMLFLIYRKEKYFNRYERYRSLGDVIFFIPGLIFWF